MTTSQKRILVVEDNEINRAMLCGILAPEYAVLEAENGQEALTVLKDYKGEVSLIMLDIVMPVMDGYTFLSIVKGDPAFSSIPVIVSTQSDSESDEVAALSHGAADFVAKPYRPQIILHRVASIIHLRETAAMVNQFEYDQLTGVYSKEFFYKRVKEILLQNPEQEYDILCSDIENFKLINDVFGVPAGDRLLCGVADMYAALVGDNGICGRFHADQFVCLLKRQKAYADELFIQAEGQLNALSKTKSVAVKWGIYSIKDRTVSVEQMCDWAFMAARSIKGQYGKHFAVYDEKLRNQLLREQAITDSMETALWEGQFVIYLQPKYFLEDDSLAGAEALVRWNHPEWGFLSPAEFIPLFEKNGFIARLDQFVWEKTCEILHSWSQKGYPSIPISVNVSRADVYQADLADFLTGLVKKYELAPSLLHLEITESAYTENPEQIIETVNHLRELGFIIEMDDFGTGYSSLNMLNKMPLDVLKLDMNFIQSETAKPIDQGILQFIMGLARWMNLTVVAEGVEKEEQLNRLREIGCDYVQGYLFSKPVPREEFEDLVKGLRKQPRKRNPERVDYGKNSEFLLIAEENPYRLSKLNEIFKEKYKILEASDEKSVLEWIAKFGERIRLALISLTLPNCQGYSVLKVFQKEKEIWKLPVIAMGPADAEMEEQALELGADDFVFRPFSSRSLWKRTAQINGLYSYQEKERILQDEANRDYLTGLLNRRGLNVAFEKLRREDLPIAVYLFDLDNLKQINDCFGHREGDRVIQKFGELLCEYTRGSDIIARFGGDEFVVIMKQMGTEKAAIRKGEEICRAFHKSSCLDNEMAACSVGIVLSRLVKDTVADLIIQADKALYRAKSENKGGCCLWMGKERDD